MLSGSTVLAILLVLPFILAADVERSTRRYGATTHGPLDYLCTSQARDYLLPYPFDCHKFIECDGHGHSKIIDCAEDLQFDNKLKKCNYPDLVTCWASSHAPPSPTPRSSPTPTPTPETRPTPTPTHGPYDELCFGKPDYYLVPYPYDCAKYLQCINQRSTLMNCEVGKWFDTTVRACNFQHLVHCSPSTSVGPTTPTTTTTTKKPDPYCKGKPDRWVRPYPYDCSKFIECVNEENAILPCPAGFLFDATYKTCRMADTVNCTPSTTIAPSPHIPSCRGIRDGTLLRHPTDCDKYIYCEKEESIIKICPLGYLFDNLIKACNYDYLVDCAKF